MASRWFLFWGGVLLWVVVFANSPRLTGSFCSEALVLITSAAATAAIWAFALKHPFPRWIRFLMIVLSAIFSLAFAVLFVFTAMDLEMEMRTNPLAHRALIDTTAEIAGIVGACWLWSRLTRQNRRKAASGDKRDFSS
ncbi:MAG: hypothetical protein LAQ30_04890 [Acidobacteriia bacterium]|nr:hypothetical protein [Terriglobia bacterium]